MAVAIEEQTDGQHFRIYDPGLTWVGPGIIITIPPEKEAIRKWKITGLLEYPVASRLDQACQAPGIPAVHDSHPTTNWLEVKTVESQLHGPDVATVTVNYKKKAMPPSGSNLRVEIGSTQVSTDVDYDWYGNRIKVTDNDRTYYGSIPLPLSLPVITVTEYEKTLSEAVAASAYYSNTVSNGGPLGGARRTWKCSEVLGRPIGDTSKYQVEFRFKYNPLNWDASPGQDGWYWHDTMGHKYNDPPAGLKNLLFQRYREVAFPFNQL